VKLAAKVASLSLLSACLFGQEQMSHKAPSVTLVPVPIASILRGKSTIVNLEFHVDSGFHINSNKPSAEYLIPTTLKVEPPTDIMVGQITYPPGQEMGFAFDPSEKLSVYSGSFTVGVSVLPLSNVLPSKYELRGTLKYQACDNAACYPPKTIPVQFEVKVVKAPPPPKKNPAQSPHA
jgi:Disulphide bond corrector protein DsbC